MVVAVPRIERRGDDDFVKWISAVAICAGAREESERVLSKAPAGGAEGAGVVFGL